VIKKHKYTVKQNNFTQKSS